jgi:hypothetical protein
MNTKFPNAFGIPVVAIVLIAVLAAAAARADDGPPPLRYAIEDQFGVTHTEAECRGAVTVLLGGDRKGSEYIDDWSSALQRAMRAELEKGSVCTVGFAHLKGAPFFVRKKIVDSFPKDEGAWTLLDWKGHMVKTWGGEKKAANLYIFDGNGRFVVHEALRGFDKGQFDGIERTIRETVGGGI